MKWEDALLHMNSKKVFSNYQKSFNVMMTLLRLCLRTHEFNFVS